MLFDLIDLSKLRRAVSYALVLVALFIVQDRLASHLTILGVRPLLVPAVAAAAGLYDGALWGGLVGLAAGYFADVGCIESTVLLTLLYPAAGFFSGVLGKYLLHRGFLSYMTLFFGTVLLVTLAQMSRFWFAGTDQIAVWRTGLIQLLWSLPWAVPAYFPCRAIAARPLGTFS